MFKTTTEDLIALSEWLAAEGCTRITMEATGIYGRAVWLIGVKNRLHSGPVAKGSFVQTLVLADIVTGWTKCAPLLVRGQLLLTGVQSELRKLRHGERRSFSRPTAFFRIDAAASRMGAAPIRHFC
jgi:hypothetical protein